MLATATSSKCSIDLFFHNFPLFFTFYSIIKIAAVQTFWLFQFNLVKCNRLAGSHSRSLHDGQAAHTRVVRTACFGANWRTPRTVTDDFASVISSEIVCARVRVHTYIVISVEFLAPVRADVRGPCCGQRVCTHTYLISRLPTHPLITARSAIACRS